MSEVTSLTDTEVTFSVWPENAGTNYDVMNMYVDGHFRPQKSSSLRERADIFSPKEITTEQRILDMALDRGGTKSEYPAWARPFGSWCHKSAKVASSRASEACVIDMGGSTMNCGGGLLQTVHMAYNFEKDLIITPDDVLLTIMAGVGSHISKDPEKYRHVFVDFEGKKEIQVECEHPPSMWEESGVFEKLIQEIGKEAGDQRHLHEALMCDFSTTTSLEKMLCQLGVMDATRHYFDFTVGGFCGIKSVTLKGTEQDWCSLRQKIEALSIIGDLDWWLGDLRLILDQFIRARRGDIALSFWRRMIKGYHADKGMYEPEAINCSLTGWVLAFFPCTREGKRVCSLTFSEQQATERLVAELGTCTECNEKQTSGETGRGKFYCGACWQAYDLMRHWHGVMVQQEDLEDGMLSASIKWEQCGKKVADVDVYGGVVGPNVPSDKFAPLQTVRGYVMKLRPSAEENAKKEAIGRVEVAADHAKWEQEQVRVRQAREQDSSCHYSFLIDTRFSLDDTDYPPLHKGAGTSAI